MNWERHPRRKPGTRDQWRENWPPAELLLPDDETLERLSLIPNQGAKLANPGENDDSSATVAESVAKSLENPPK